MLQSHTQVSSKPVPSKPSNPSDATRLRPVRRGMGGLFLLAWLVCLACPVGLSVPLAAQVPPANPAPETLPRDLGRLPGNASLSLPLRWTEGTLQVVYRQDQIPLSTVGKQLTAISLRRPAWFDEVGYPARTRTLRLHVQVANRQPVNLRRDLAVNRDATTVHGFGPAQVTIAASSAGGAGDATGDVLCTIPVQPPFVIPGSGGILVEIETLDGPLSIDGMDILWVDAIEALDGSTGGLAFELGQTGCSTKGDLRLVLPEGADVPGFDEDFQVSLTGARPGAVGFLFQMLNPYQMQPGLGLGFGADLTPLQAPGCFQWTEVDLAAAVPFTVGSQGTIDLTTKIPPGVAGAGNLAALQVVMVEPALNPVGYASSTGLLLSVGSNWIQDGVATVLSPGTKTKSPWERFLGLAPVLELTVQ
jgi:hypothetical protein